MTETELLDRLGRVLLESAPDAIVYSDGEGVIRFWSAGAERLFGFAAAEAVGQSLDIIIPEPQRARHWAGYRQVMATGESRYGHGDLLAVPGLRKDGSRVSLEFTIVPMRDEAGRMEGMAAILRDVTKRFEEMRALRRELAAIRQSRRADSNSAAVARSGGV
ncbi:MAG: PAS domain S-box protein [Acetobacteraceae bacterium]|nr:PAS domain S-box protein [Acetobacteraceae bacterium]